MVERVVSLELKLELDEEGDGLVVRIDVVEAAKIFVGDQLEPVMTICRDKSFPIPS